MSITPTSPVATGSTQAQLEAAVLSKMMKTVQEHQSQSPGMIEVALKVARDMRNHEKGKGAIVDVFA